MSRSHRAAKLRKNLLTRSAVRFFTTCYGRECGRGKLPSLHCKEGWLRHQRNLAKPPKLTQPGWFSFLVAIGRPPRLRYHRMLRDIFLLAQPPLPAVMQGGEHACHPRDSLEFGSYTSILSPLAER